MPCYICETCGTQHADTPEPPGHCSICEDARQYVGWHGQTWTTHAALAGRFQLRIEDDDGLLGIGIRSNFAIPQRALLLPTREGNLLWDVRAMRDRLSGYEYEDVYGYTWGRNIIGNGRAAVEASFDRHLCRVTG